MKRLLSQNSLNISVSTINDKKVVEIIANGKGMIFSCGNTDIGIGQLESEILEFISNVPVNRSTVEKVEMTDEQVKESITIEEKKPVAKKELVKTKTTGKKDIPVDGLFKSGEEKKEPVKETTKEKEKVQESTSGSVPDNNKTEEDW